MAHARRRRDDAPAMAGPAAKCVGLLLDGRAQTSGIRRLGGEASLLLITNAHHDVVAFTLPKAAGGRDWLRLVDTNTPDEERTTTRARPSGSGIAIR